MHLYTLAIELNDQFRARGYIPSVYQVVINSSNYFPTEWLFELYVIEQLNLRNTRLRVELRWEIR